MRKLTDKIKYRLADGHAELFARHKQTQQFQCFGTCHLSTLDHIKANGLKASLEAGLIRVS
ncbi:hypothetical protein G3A43_08545 [Paraburkholderia aspalathi]|nr:hypothetical protein [Paraburkholderia aspalathi]MBK3780305.1 hypothetical protein [Paraburkholderia aspalathi]